MTSCRCHAAAWRDVWKELALSDPVRPIRTIDDVDRMRASEPLRYRELLAWYRELLGTAVVDAADAIERSEAGAIAPTWAYTDDRFNGAVRVALREVLERRLFIEEGRPELDLTAAEILAASRLLSADEVEVP